MYVEPNTNIRILRNVPLDTTYEHTLYFEKYADQSTYFYKLEKYNLEKYTYQRVKKGVARVGINADNLYDCNYMMFQNTGYGNKWFYAFITAVEFVNNECAEIYFEIDVMQTWLFDYKFDMCFVEREHSATDEIGDNIAPEGVETGEYVFNNYEPVTPMNSMVVCIAIVDTDGQSEGTLYEGIYGGAELWVYDSTDIQTINAKINEYAQKPNAIISMYMFPKILINEIPETHRLNYGATGAMTNVILAPITKTDTIDGYTPKNAKLYTYPYNYYHIDNASGGGLSLRYEFFDSLTPVVEISGTITQPVVACIRPCSYKGVTPYSEIGGYHSLNTESLQMNNYPICSWNNDAFQTWIAQNAVPIALNTVSTVGRSLNYMPSHAFGYAPWQKMSNTRSGISEATNLLNQFYTASIQADVVRGTLNNGNVNVAVGKQQFYGGRCSVNHEYAKMIDDYFTMYGYAVKQCKKPNINSRPHWNYIKTANCTLTGSIPCDDMRKICSIYDNGITFWKNGAEIGDYSLDNSV